MRIVASVKRSAGNDTVGEMWTETATFDKKDSLGEVFTWAEGINVGGGSRDIVLTIDQSSGD